MGKLALTGFLSTSNTSSWLAAGNTRYRGVGTGDFRKTSVADTETRNQIKYRTAGTMSNLAVYVPTNTLSVTGTIRSRINAANGNQVLSVGAGATGIFEDTTNTDTISAGDNVSLSLVAAAGSGSMRPTSMTMHYDVSGDYVTRLASTIVNSLSVDATPYYTGLPQQIGQSTNFSEANKAYEFKTAVTTRNLMVRVNSNTRTHSCTIKVRKNGSNGSQSITIGAGATGFFEDTTNTDSYVAGDDFAIQFDASSGTGLIAIDTLAIDSVSSNSESEFATSDQIMQVSPASTVYYAPLNPDTVANDAGNRCYPRIEFTAKQLSCLVTANPLSGSSTLKFFKNGSAGSQAITIGAGATGYFADASNTDSMAASDAFSYELIAGSGSDNLVLRYIGIVASYASGTTYSDTISESISSADVYSAVMLFANSVSEGLTGGESLGSSLTTAAALSESLTASDSFSGSNDWTTFDDGVSPNPGATVTGLTNGTTYEVRVIAVNSAGLSEASNIVEVTPTP